MHDEDKVQFAGEEPSRLYEHMIGMFAGIGIVATVVVVVTAAIWLFGGR